jgi:hypothetical protein
MLAQGSHSAHGLLYIAAVRGDWREHEGRRHRLTNTLSKSARQGPARVMTVRDLGYPFSSVRTERLRT